MTQRLIHKYTKEDDDFIRELYGKFTDREIAIKLSEIRNKTISRKAIYSRRLKLDLYTDERQKNLDTKLNKEFFERSSTEVAEDLGLRIFSFNRNGSIYVPDGLKEIINS